MQTCRQLSDEALIGLLQGGDHGAFTEIYERYKGMLYLHAHRKLRDEDEVDDLIHELFAALWTKRSTIQFRGNLSGYLYVAVRNRVLDRISHQQVVERYQQSFYNYVEQGQMLTDHRVRENELRHIIEKEVANLPPKMREVFQLSRFQQRSHKEIAEELQISEKTVKNQINHALKILKGKLGPLYILLFFLYP